MVKLGVGVMLMYSTSIAFEINPTDNGNEKCFKDHSKSDVVTVIWRWLDSSLIYSFGGKHPSIDKKTCTFQL